MSKSMIGFTQAKSPNVCSECNNTYDTGDWMAFDNRHQPPARLCDVCGNNNADALNQAWRGNRNGGSTEMKPPTLTTSNVQSSAKVSQAVSKKQLVEALDQLFTDDEDLLDAALKLVRQQAYNAAHDAAVTYVKEPGFMERRIEAALLDHNKAQSNQAYELLCDRFKREFEQLVTTIVNDKLEQLEQRLKQSIQVSINSGIMRLDHRIYMLENPAAVSTPPVEQKPREKTPELKAVIDLIAEIMPSAANVISAHFDLEKYTDDEIILSTHKQRFFDMLHSKCGAVEAAIQPTKLTLVLKGNE